MEQFKNAKSSKCLKLKTCSGLTLTSFIKYPSNFQYKQHLSKTINQYKNYKNIYQILSPDHKGTRSINIRWNLYSHYYMYLISFSGFNKEQASWRPARQWDVFRLHAATIEGHEMNSGKNCLSYSQIRKKLYSNID